MASEGEQAGGQATPVVHNEAARRFEIRQGENLAVLDYLISGATISMFHTEVPTALEGRGYGSQLARAALDYARGRQLRVLPDCSFIRGYIERHPEYAELVSDQR